MVGKKLDWVQDELSARDEQGLLRRLNSCERTADPVELIVDGKSLINFASNDYLGLAADLASELQRTSRGSQGWGSGASPLITGRSEAHQQLETALAEFKGTEAALSFSTGYAANIGAITAVTGEQDVIFSDARNHASIIDGCRLSRADVQIYRHNDIDHLTELCSQASGYRRKLIVTDSLFSMDGDLARLDVLAELAEQCDAMLMVDEAHATGVFGKSGRGLAQQLDCESGIDISVGTLSKALGSIGGFVGGNQELIDLLVNKARPYIYSTAMPSLCAQAGKLALERVIAEPERRHMLFERVRYLSDGLRQRGLLEQREDSPIVPVVSGDPKVALARSKQLGEAGFYIPAIRPPTVPVGASCLRISLSSAHTVDQLDQLMDALR